MVNKIAIALGFRSKCCGAKIEAWHADKSFCTQCHSWLGRDKKPVKTTEPLVTEVSNELAEV